MVAGTCHIVHIVRFYPYPIGCGGSIIFSPRNQGRKPVKVKSLRNTNQVRIYECTRNVRLNSYIRKKFVFRS